MMALPGKAIHDHSDQVDGEKRKDKIGDRAMIHPLGGDFSVTVLGLNNSAPRGQSSNGQDDQHRKLKRCELFDNSSCMHGANLRPLTPKVKRCAPIKRVADALQTFINLL